MVDWRVFFCDEKCVYIYIHSILKMTTGKIRKENYEYNNYRLRTLIICNSMNYYCTQYSVSSIYIGDYSYISVY